MNSFMTKLRRLCGASNPEKPHTTLSLSFASAETTFESEPSDSDSSDEKEDSLSAHASQISVNSVHSDDPESQREHHSLDLTNPQFVIDITPQVSAV